MGEKETTTKKVETKMDDLYLLTFDNVSKVKSVRRAIRRGRMSKIGILYPKRPFNNRKDKPLEKLKRNIYYGIKLSEYRRSLVEA